MIRGIITNNKSALVVAFIGFIALMVGFIAILVSSGSQKERGFSYGYFVPESVEFRTREADSIALVTIEDVGRARWSTADGKGSIGAVQEAIRSERDSATIYRPVTLKVEKYLKNPQPETTLTIHQEGGEVDGVILEATYAIGFQKGMRAIVFLARQKPPSPIEWDLFTVYVIKGAVAHSKWDQRSMNVDELLSVITRIAEQTP